MNQELDERINRLSPKKRQNPDQTEVRESVFASPLTFEVEHTVSARKENMTLQ